MANRTETIRKFVGFLNNTDEQGGFWLPNIQRPFVRKEEQIERLYDSILREYPIGTILVWKTRSGIKRRKFIDNYHPNLRLTDFYVPEDVNAKMMVLDGQQQWFADKPEDYLNLHLIPRNRELWKIDNFEAFVEERNKLILDKFSCIIYQN